MCIVINDATGIQDIDQGDGETTIYPNPNNGVFTIQIANSYQSVGSNRVEVYNMLGEKIYQESGVTNKESTINLTGKPAGVYLYRVVGETGRLIGDGKFIID